MGVGLCALQVLGRTDSRYGKGEVDLLEENATGVRGNAGLGRTWWVRKRNRKGPARRGLGTLGAGRARRHGALVGAAAPQGLDARLGGGRHVLALEVVIDVGVGDAERFFVRE